VEEEMEEPDEEDKSLATDGYHGNMLIFCKVCIGRCKETDIDTHTDRQTDRQIDR